MNEEPTIINAPPDEGRTQVITPQVEKTQMGEMVQCPVCMAKNMALELYCVECGFLLSSQPETAAAQKSAPAMLRDVRTGRKFELLPGTYSVGRDNTDILLSDPSVSRQHAAIEIRDTDALVTDLGSTNGTMIGAEKLTPNDPSALLPGQEVRFGNCVLAFEITEQAEEPIADADTVSVDDDLESIASVDDDDEEVSESVEPDVVKTPAVAELLETASGARHRVGLGGATIGRKDTNDIVISNPYVSSSHAKIAVIDGQLVLTDLGSTNGTMLNSAKLEANVGQALSDGDIISFGGVEVRVELAEGQTS